MIEAALSRLGIPYEPAVSTTWRRQQEFRGIEADECYHIQSLARVVGKTELDLAIDPPPDLAIEIEATVATLDKVANYQSLKVPELWQISGDSDCVFLRLSAAGAYEPVARSVAVPLLTSVLVSNCLQRRARLGHSLTLRQLAAEVTV